VFLKAGEVARRVEDVKSAENDLLVKERSSDGKSLYRSEKGK